MKTLPNELILLDLISSKELANELEKIPENARYKSIRLRTEREKVNGEKAILMYSKDGEFIRRFRSCYEAERELKNTTRVNIRRACKNFAKGHTAGGYKFKYERE